MSDWSHGYNVEGEYTFGFYREMSPVWLDYVGMLTGAQTPQGNGRRYLELGCGQGFHLFTLVAANSDRNEAIRQATLFIEKPLPAWERLGAWS